MQSRTCQPARGYWLIALLLLIFCGAAQAQELEGTWKLVMRKLPDGTTQVPPAVQGAGTWYNGLRSLVVFWHTPEGKPAHASGIYTYKMSGTEFTETLGFFAFNDGSGKPPTYNLNFTTGATNLTGATESTPVAREGGRLGFKLPFGEPSVVLEGDKLTATAEGQFVDYWERVR
jgi:hypothetical protein